MIILLNLPNCLGQARSSKEKIFKGESYQFCDKKLRKAIMKRSKLGNDFLKDRNDTSQSAYRKQRNLPVTLLRKTKKQYSRIQNQNLKQKILEIS